MDPINSPPILTFPDQRARTEEVGFREILTLVESKVSNRLNVKESHDSQCIATLEQISTKKASVTGETFN
eukprot:CAMPEP_0118663334 /NCGR_PEP_ID=MMETSP0785-20121206/17360_1 /TAXON_ID=91992 /ORGANISM="Bolidomonas pacifica, Strain CCMP 1866" /LENGTH=69 /DNA_ID=CAMNT_0006557039 /DNA_START=382 /DNA_END=591 /DNA_ORIENTATION=-